MKPDLLRAGETDMDRQLRLALQQMARLTDLPAEAWGRFDVALREWQRLQDYAKEQWYAHDPQ
jgi:hypothetical protein